MDDKTEMALESIDELNRTLLCMTEEEIKIFCASNRKTIQNLIDALSY